MLHVNQCYAFAAVPVLWEYRNGTKAVRVLQMARFTGRTLVQKHASVVLIVCVCVTVRVAVFRIVIIGVVIAAGIGVAPG